jgi:hypothetical protein
MPRNSITIFTGLALAAVLFITTSAASEDLSGYNPTYSLGSEDKDWWTGYPNENPNPGASVDHPSWVLQSLKEKPVIILLHSASCKSCAAQMKALSQILKTYRKDIAYYNIRVDSNDSRGREAFEAYDPTGGSNYVPTTIFLTEFKDTRGKTSLAWHSYEDAMSESDVEAYIKDAIYYYRQSNGGGA